MRALIISKSITRRDEQSLTKPSTEELADLVDTKVEIINRIESAHHRCTSLDAIVVTGEDTTLIELMEVT